MQRPAFPLLTAALLAASFSLTALADTVKISDPWARATAPGAPAAGAFMGLTADADMTLVAAESNVSKVVELHTMKMENGVMVMRAVPKIDLPKGQTVNLKPGGLHVMFIGLHAPLKAGEKVDITLRLKDSQGKEQRVPVTAEIRTMKPMHTPPAHSH
ncbi:MAG: copper chaperone PCu(A)C [Betaproteobacteria bacterium]|nr:copper chaperone PCu(A)C [Betaproteobacteria bacterium]